MQVRKGESRSLFCTSEAQPSTRVGRLEGEQQRRVNHEWGHGTAASTQCKALSGVLTLLSKWYQCRVE